MEVDRALMMDVVVRFSSCHYLVKVRVVLSSTRQDSEGPIEGMGELCVLMGTKWLGRRDSRRVELARERALPLLLSAAVMQHFRT
jgi:hypothetical protein